MKIAVAQMSTQAGDFEATCERMESFAHMAADQGAKLVVYPMTALTGPIPVDYPSREGFQTDMLVCLGSLAASVPCACLVPVVMSSEGEPYHEVMLLKEGSITPLRYEAFLRGGEGGLPQDPTRMVVRFELAGTRFALAQTYDDLDELIDISPEVDVVVYVSDYAYALDDAGSVLGAALSENRFTRDAVSLDAAFVAVGSVGAYGQQVYGGSSFALAPSGALIAVAPAFEESLLVAQLPAVASEAASEENVQLEPEIYNRSLHLWQALVLGLHDYCAKAGHTDVALALDGSLASCLLATLASDAVGPQHVHALVCATGDNERVRVSREVAQSLRVNVHTCDKALLDACANDSTLACDIVNACLARMARQTGSVPLDAADKTFLALEVSTASCHTAELLPFGDVYRTDLVELAHLRNTISPVVPARAFAFVGVPDLAGIEQAGATAELRLKFVDVTLATYLEWERCLSDVVARQGMPELCEALFERLYTTEVARCAMPLCIVASSRPLFAAQMPLGLAWHDSVRSDEERMAGKKATEALMPPLRMNDDAELGVPDLSQLLRGLEVELKGGSGLEGVSKEELEGAVGEVLGLLQDMSAGDSGAQPSIEGPFGPLTWGSPFSEN